MADRNLYHESITIQKSFLSVRRLINLEIKPEKELCAVTDSLIEIDNDIKNEWQLASLYPVYCICSHPYFTNQH